MVRFTPTNEVRAARYAVAAIFCINGMALANWITRIPDVKAALGLSDALLGIALFSLAGGALAAQVITGWLVGRYGSRGVTTALAIGFGLSVALPGQTHTLPQLIAALVVLGGLNGGLDVAMNAQAALVERRYERTIMSSFHGLWSAGGLIGAGIGGLLGARGVALPWHLGVVAIVTASLMALVSRWLLADPPHADGGPAFAAPPRALLAMGLLAFSVLLCEGAVADWSAVYLRDGLGAGPGMAAAGYGAFALTMAAGRLSGDWIILRLGPLAIVRGGAVLVVLGVGLALLGGLVPLAVVGFGLIGAGLATVFPLILSAAARTPGVAPATAIAAMATAGYSGFLVGPPLIGSAAAALTLRGALGLLALCGLLMLLLAGRLRSSTDGHR